MLTTTEAHMVIGNLGLVIQSFVDLITSFLEKTIYELKT
jgi:hypothetical protein